MNITPHLPNPNGFPRRDPRTARRLLAAEASLPGNRMSEQRDQTVKCVVHTLDSTNTASHIMSVYFDEDR
jgi:hypothetical protein